MHALMKKRPSAVVALAIAAIAASFATGSPASADLRPVPNSVQQVYRAGTETAPSTAVTDYTGELLTLQATYVGSTTAEPTIGVAPDGTAYFAGATINIDTNVVWGTTQTHTMRSLDGGLTWQRVQFSVPVTETSIIPASADPMIYVDPETGRVFNIDLYGACSWLNYSDTRGDSWKVSPAACGVIANDHQTIVAAKPRGGLTTTGYPNALFYCVNRIVDQACGRSLDGGDTWGPTESAAYIPGGGCAFLHGHLEADPEGRIYLPNGNCGRKPWISASDDSGKTWTRTKVSDLNSVEVHTSVAADAAGNLYYVWIAAVGPTQNQTLPFLSVSQDGGATWSTPRMIGPPGLNHANFPVVAAGDEGHIAINFPGTLSKTQAGKAPWNQYVVVSTNALEADPLFLSATANDPAADPVHRGACTGRCNGMWDFIDVQISAQGEAWAAAADDCNGPCDPGTSVTADKAGRGIAIRQIGGPKLRS